MTTDLRDGLHDLAERRPAAVPPPDLWCRGVRRRRRVRALAAGATAAAVAAGVLLTTVGLDAVRTADPAPADTSGSGAIPDRLHTPSPWLDGTEGHPPGPLAVIAGAERRTGWRGTLVNGWVGVSASTGEYRFLDLPGAVDLGTDDWYEADPVLSPDGRAVAYWLAHPDDARWVGGWAVYDTVSGDVVRHRVGSPLGLASETLAWTGAGTVLVEYSVVTRRDGGSFGGRGRPMVLWSPATGEVAEPEDDTMPVGSVWATGRGVVTVDGTRIGLRDAVTGAAELSIEAEARRDVGAGAVNPEGTVVTFLPQTSGLAVRRLLVAEVPADIATGVRVQTEPVPVDLDMYDLVGWQDPDHVLVRALLPPPQRRWAGIYAVDVRSGDHRLLVSETRDNWIGSPDYADDLWAQATVSRPGPDRAYDPRLLAGAGGLVAGGLVLLVVRRRRARG